MKNVFEWIFGGTDRLNGEISKSYNLELENRQLKSKLRERENLVQKLNNRISLLENRRNCETRHFHRKFAGSYCNEHASECFNRARAVLERAGASIIEERLDPSTGENGNFATVTFLYKMPQGTSTYPEELEK